VILLLLKGLAIAFALAPTRAHRRGVSRSPAAAFIVPSTYAMQSEIYPQRSTACGPARLGPFKVTAPAILQHLQRLFVAS
jgi:hypothetical protein